MINLNLSYSSRVVPFFRNNHLEQCSSIESLKDEHFMQISISAIISFKSNPDSNRILNVTI